MTHFVPVDQAAHDRANGGYNISDRCRNCGQDFMQHYNSKCPKSGDELRDQYLNDSEEWHTRQGTLRGFSRTRQGEAFDAWPDSMKKRVARDMARSLEALKQRDDADADH